MKNEIKANGARYLSQIPEFTNGLPHGILNKATTDVGGTFAALNCESNYIIVTPTIDLIHSVLADRNVKYRVFGVYSGVLYMQFKKYLFENSIHKIVVTYDSLPKVKKWLDRNGFESSKYKVLVDEYHLLLEDMGFRDKAINSLINLIGKFDHYTFMSATPNPETFLPEAMLKLPYTQIDWGSTTMLKPTRMLSTNVFKTMVNLINQFKIGFSLKVNGNNVRVQEFYIFLNSVKGIKQIVDSANLTNDEIKVVCTDSIRNKTILGSIKISKVTEPNASINFFTKKGFQGCNLFSNNGLVIVVSDGQKEHTLVDISTTMHQIAGRLRTNESFDNIFKDRIWHIYSTPLTIQSDDEFKLTMDRIKHDSDIVSTTYNNFDSVEQAAFKNRLDIEDLVCYFDDETNKYIYSELKEKYLIYNHELINKVYNNGISIRDSYIKAGFKLESDQFYRKDEEIILKKASTVGFRELLEQYMKLKKENSEKVLIERYELENPIFKEAWEVLGESGIKTCEYVESNIKERIYAKSDTTMKGVYNTFFKKVGNNNFISNSDAKMILISVFDDYRIKGYKPTLGVLYDCKWFDVSTGKRRIDGKAINGIILNQIRNQEISNYGFYKDN